MNVATLRLELRVADCLTLGQKRRRLARIIGRLHRHFNVSVAEVDALGRPGEAVLGVAAVAATRREAREILARVADALNAHPRAELIGTALREV